MNNTTLIAQELRQLVIKMLTQAGSGHSGGSLGMTDVFAVLYFSDVLNLDPTHPNDPNRDRVILSNGHICPIWYATLAKRGYFPLDQLDTLRQFGSPLQGHPHKNFSSHPSPGSSPNLPGIENSSGPLGQGVGFAVGLALGLRSMWQQGIISRLPRVVCLCGDGELDEGQCWEAFMTAAKYQLTHLTFIIDRNNIQIDGYTDNVMPLNPLKDKLNSFGLLAAEVDGHNHASLTATLQFDATTQVKPLVIIANTIPGKGVSFMENQYQWHGKVPNPSESAQALRDLEYV